jgi:hypothetical protein
MNIPVDHRIVSLKFEQCLRDNYPLAILMPRTPEQFDNEEYIAGYTCEVQLSNNPKDILTFVIEFSNKYMAFCRLDSKGSLNLAFKLEFYDNVTTLGQLSKKGLERFIKFTHLHFQSDMQLLK